jgi:hypothetical protein
LNSVAVGERRRNFQAAIPIGKFHGIMMATTPTGSHVMTTSMPGLTLDALSPETRRHSPAKKSKIWAPRVASAGRTSCPLREPTAPDLLASAVTLLDTGS